MVNQTLRTASRSKKSNKMASAANASSRTSRSLYNRTLRSQKGEGLVSGVAGTLLFIAIAVPVGIFFINASIQLIVQSQLAHIANQAANVVDSNRYWLGQPRPGFNSGEAEKKAQAAAKILCDRVGLPPVRVDVQLDPPAAGDDVSITQVDVTVDVTRAIPFRIALFGYDFGKFFPTALTARGVSANANVKPYALMHFEAPATVDGDQRGKFKSPIGANLRETAFIPIYGFGLKTVAGVPDTSITRADHPTHFGDLGVQNLNPENFIAFNHYNLIQEDLDSLKKGSEGGGLDQVKSSCWHIQRVFGGSPSNATEKKGVGLTP